MISGYYSIYVRILFIFFGDAGLSLYFYWAFSSTLSLENFLSKLDKKLEELFFSCYSSGFSFFSFSYLIFYSFYLIYLYFLILRSLLFYYSISLFFNSFYKFNRSFSFTCWISNQSFSLIINLPLNGSIKATSFSFTQGGFVRSFLSSKPKITFFRSLDKLIYDKKSFCCCFNARYSSIKLYASIFEFWDVFCSRLAFLV